MTLNPRLTISSSWPGVEWGTVEEDTAGRVHWCWSATKDELVPSAARASAALLRPA